MPVAIDLARCDGCCGCIAVCPNAVLGLREGKAAVFNGRNCLHCGDCEVACPKGAVRLKG
ncbi:MAG: 4Fe-4S binding protein [Candidatus Omnitrophota bacterium]|nr:4Fe-4S binding protein [Candidatus Omnitrophota bacterium]